VHKSRPEAVVGDGRRSRCQLHPNLRIPRVPPRARHRARLRRLLRSASEGTTVQHERNESLACRNWRRPDAGPVHRVANRRARERGPTSTKISAATPSLPPTIRRSRFGLRDAHANRLHYQPQSKRAHRTYIASVSEASAKRQRSVSEASAKRQRSVSEASARCSAAANISALGSTRNLRLLFPLYSGHGVLGTSFSRVSART